MAESWMYSALLRAQPYNYSVIHDRVIIGSDDVGSVEEIVKSPLGVLKFIETKLRSIKMAQQVNETRALIEEAKKDGETVAEFILYLSPEGILQVPQMTVWYMLTRIGKVFGYVDTDSNDAFKFAFMGEIGSYQKANQKKLIKPAKPVETKKSQWEVEDYD